MPMTPRSNSLSMRAAGNLRVLVHLADERADLGVGELAHAVAKQPLVFGQAGQRGRQGFGGRGRHDPEWYHWLSVACRSGARQCAGATDGFHMTRRVVSSLALVAAVCAAPVLLGQTPAAAPPQQADVPRTRRLGQRRRRWSPTRPGKPVTDLTADDFEVKEGKTVQTVDTFKLIKIDDNPRPGDRRARFSRSTTSGARPRATTRGCIVIFLDDYHTRRGNGMRMREQARAVREHADRSRSGRRGVSAHAADRADVHPQPRRDCGRDREVRGPEVRLHAEERVRRARTRCRRPSCRSRCGTTWSSPRSARCASTSDRCATGARRCSS